MPSRIARTAWGVERSRSVSSMRRTKTPFSFRAKRKLKRAVRAPPMWRYPVGEGANRTRTCEPCMLAFLSRAGLRSDRRGGALARCTNMRPRACILKEDEGHRGEHLAGPGGGAGRPPGADRHLEDARRGPSGGDAGGPRG